MTKRKKSVQKFRIADSLAKTLNPVLNNASKLKQFLTET